jgi:hypothetical protein
LIDEWRLEKEAERRVWGRVHLESFVRIMIDIASFHVPLGCLSLKDASKFNGKESPGPATRD